MKIHHKEGLHCSMKLNLKHKGGAGLQRRGHAKGSLWVKSIGRLRERRGRVVRGLR